MNQVDHFEEQYRSILTQLGAHVRLVAVSKTKPVEDIRALYALGQRDFGENYVQELVDKQAQLPADIRWHFIGHLQSNKVKYIASFVHLIHGVDSPKLLREIHKQAARQGRVIDCLLQVHVAREETKFGLDGTELAAAMEELASKPSDFSQTRVRGLMGMASFTEDKTHVREEFHALKTLFDRYFPTPGFVSDSNLLQPQANQNTSLPQDHSTSPSSLSTLPSPLAPPPSSLSITPDEGPLLSMGMSADYAIAIEEGSNMVRIGSLLFGKRG